MPAQLVVFDHVELVARDGLGFRCRVQGHVVWVGNLQWQKGTTVNAVGDRLVLFRADAASLGLDRLEAVDPIRVAIGGPGRPSV